MPKRQRSIGLSHEIIEWIEKNRGHLSFSSFTELLIRRGIETIEGSSKPVELRGEAREPRRRIIVAR